jgi:hypothetical protein
MHVIEEIHEGLELAGSFIELFAVLVIIVGFVRAAVTYTHTEVGVRPA